MGSCENGNELPGCSKHRKFHEHLSDFWLLKKDSTQWNELNVNAGASVLRNIVCGRRQPADSHGNYFLKSRLLGREITGAESLTSCSLRGLLAVI